MPKTINDVIELHSLKTGLSVDFIIKNELVVELEAEADREVFMAFSKDDIPVEPGTKVGCETCYDDEWDLALYDGYTLDYS